MAWRNFDDEAKETLKLLLDKGYDIEDICKFLADLDQGIEIEPIEEG